ncbi:MAG: 2-succinyl-5-enolpyruvyl-6-hydroxy-3-cyclohexene-1-carboxylic-acid synthase [Melioribacter sp.]|nr:2-succinyl-5-enolpyruvyl-6-hydroxy-3-cyclohexene-1-carboxylic-acid synthase [Melioribacter sp.]
MKISVNKNTVWCDIIVNRLCDYEVKFACISPGSRSTPITLALSLNKNIKVFPIVDERSSAFFALGLAKKSKTPVCVVTTSGTAVAELYPAIIEAYYQRIPLIICTADRPPYLRNTGANQTINQENIFKNHIRFFSDLGLPTISFKSLVGLIKTIDRAMKIALIENPGPIHLNLPFEKPFEPDSYTEKVEVDLLKRVYNSIKPVNFKRKKFSQSLDNIFNKLAHYKKGIIIIGYNNYDEQFAIQCTKLSKVLKYPIFADASSGLRFGKHSKENFIDNFTSLLRSEKFIRKFDPDIILQFGSSPTSNVVLNFYKESKAEKILINEFGDKNDPSLTAKTIIKINPVEFCSNILKKSKSIKRKSDWLKSILQLNKIVEEIKTKKLKEEKINFEGKILFELFNILPSNCNVMISNSLPIRDTDFFVSSCNKKIHIFCNRGASGIDGINSTALGIAKLSKIPTILVIGDLAFYHDLNGLHNAIKFNIPLTIILINNNGGGIFESLPISKFGKVYVENFVTPTNLEFEKFIKAYGGIYYTVDNDNDFKVKLLSSLKNKKLSVIEIKTNAKKSKINREKIWKSITESIDLKVNENQY